MRSLTRVSTSTRPLRPGVQLVGANRDVVASKPVRRDGFVSYSRQPCAEEVFGVQRAFDKGISDDEAPSNGADYLSDDGVKRLFIESNHATKK
jgi:hypothetical protein